MAYIKFALAFLTIVQFSYAQNVAAKKINFSGYGEFYYSYDFSKPSNNDKSNFLYNHKRHNEYSINLLLAKLEYKEESLRANLAIMAGNYAQYNLSSEPTWAQFINEANVGVKLSKKRNIWLDVGILPSHIGFETAIGNDCFTLTRSICAENSPYYQSGLKLSYSNKKENLTLALLGLNGWQKIKKPDDIQKHSFGVQVNYKLNEKITVNYSNFIGTDKPDSLKANRVFHNFFVQNVGAKKLGYIIGFDIGRDKYNAINYGTWFSPNIILKYIVNKKSAIAFRYEYYYDKNQIIITTKTNNGFQVSGISTNFDYKVRDNITFRTELKKFYSKDIIFSNRERNNLSFTSSLCIKL